MGQSEVFETKINFWVVITEREVNVVGARGRVEDGVASELISFEFDWRLSGVDAKLFAKRRADLSGAGMAIGARRYEIMPTACA